MNIVEAKALGLEELQRRKDAMSQDIDRDPNEWTVIVNAISELEWEAQQNQQHEERVKQSVEAVVNTLDNVEIGGLSFRELCVGESEYQMLSIWFKQQFEAQAEAFSKQINDAVTDGKRARDEAQETINDLQDKVESKDAEISTLRAQNYQLTLDRDDAFRKLENASSELTEAQERARQLESWNEDLHKQIAVGARNAYKVVEVGSPEYAEQIKALAEKIKNERVPVTVMEPADLLGKQMRIVLAETGEEKTIGFLEKGKYRLVDSQEAAEVAERFRQTQMGLSTSNSEEAVAEPVTFPEAKAPDVDTSGMAGGQSEASEGDHGCEREAEQNDSAQSLEERVAALEEWKKRVESNPYRTAV